MSKELSAGELNALWERVSERVRVREPGDAGGEAVIAACDPLEEMLAFEREMLTRYGRLFRRAGSRRTRGYTERLLEGQKALVRRMAAACFLRTGRRPKCAPVPYRRIDALEAVRDCALWEIRRAEAYRQAGANADPSLRDLLFEAQKCKEENARLLGAVLESLMF